MSLETLENYFLVTEDRLKRIRAEIDLIKDEQETWARIERELKDKIDELFEEGVVLKERCRVLQWKIDSLVDDELRHDA